MAEYIEREAAHRIMVGLTRYSWSSIDKQENRVTVDADDVNFGLDKIPAADAAPVVHSRFVYMGGFPACERCGASPGCVEPKPDNPSGFPPYCYGCGAKMDKECSNA